MDTPSIQSCNYDHISRMARFVMQQQRPLKSDWSFHSDALNAEVSFRMVGDKMVVYVDDEPSWVVTEEDIDVEVEQLFYPTEEPSASNEDESDEENDSDEEEDSRELAKMMRLPILKKPQSSERSELVGTFIFVLFASFALVLAFIDKNMHYFFSN